MKSDEPRKIHHYLTISSSLNGRLLLESIIHQIAGTYGRRAVCVQVYLYKGLSGQKTDLPKEVCYVRMILGRFFAVPRKIRQHQYRARET